jgi:hypothetical protein
VAVGLAASAIGLIACGGSSPQPLGGVRVQAVANWLKAHRCENVTRTDAKGTVPDADYGLFLERTKSAVLVACDKGPEDSAIVWEFDTYDRMSRSLHVHAEQIRGGPYCRLTHVAFTIGNVKDGVGLCRSMLGDLVCTNWCGRRSPDFVSQRGWTKADPRTIAMGPCGSRRVKPARLVPSTSESSATEVVLVSAADRRGCLRPNIEIQSRYGGGCGGGRPNTNRCIYATPTYGTCWVTVFDRPDPKSVVCMYQPWSSEAHRLDLVSGGPRWLKPGRRPRPDLRHPWGVELVNGSRCEALSHYGIYRGPDERFKGRDIAYACDKGGCTLLRHLHKSAPIWTSERVCGFTPESGGRVAPVGVRTAWFAA